MKGLIISGVLMSLVLLPTASRSRQTVPVVIPDVGICLLLPYMYAIIALPIIMVSKSSTVDVVYVLLRPDCHRYDLQYIRPAGSGTDSIFWGTIMMMVTIPLFSLSRPDVIKRPGYSYLQKYLFTNINMEIHVFIYCRSK